MLCIPFFKSVCVSAMALNHEVFVCFILLYLNFKVCGVVQSLVLNYFVLLSVCHALACDVLLGCCVPISHQTHGFDTSHICSNLPKRV